MALSLHLPLALVQSLTRSQANAHPVGSESLSLPLTIHVREFLGAANRPIAISFPSLHLGRRSVLNSVVVFL